MKFPHAAPGAILTAVLLTAAQPALAQWPGDRPIEVVVGYAAGSGTDLMARALIPYVEKHLGGNAHIIVINKPGASGEISNAYVQRAKPDGYTLGTVNVPGFVFTPMYKKTSYQPQNLTLIARMVSDPAILIGRKNGPTQTLQQLVDAMRKKPGGITFGNNGVGTNGHLALLQLQEASHTKGIPVPYKGSTEVLTSLLAGQIDFAILSASETTQFKKDSPLTVLAQFVEPGKRTPLLPDVPTAVEQGYKVLMTSERGFAAPKGIDPSIVKRLDDAIQASLGDPGYRKAATNDWPVLSYLPGDQWRASMDKTEAFLRLLAPLMPRD